MSHTIELDEVIGKHKDALVAGIEKTLVEKVSHSIGWTAENAIQECASEFVKNEIIPAAQTYLTEHRDEIVSSVLSSIMAAFTEAGNKLSEKALKNLTSDWKLREISKAMFD